MSLAVEIVLIKLTNGNNKKVDCIECKPPSHLYFFPGPIKFKQLREAWIKKVRRETLTKKDLGNQLQAIESVPSILLMDWKLIKIPYQPFFLIMKIKKKKSRRRLFRKLFGNKSEGRLYYTCHFYFSRRRRRTTSARKFYR